MAEVENAPEEGEKKKSKKLFVIIGLVLVLLIGGGAGGYYYFVIAAANHGEETAKTEEKAEKAKSNELVLDESESESEDDSEENDDSNTLSLPDDEDVKHVVEIPPFVVNLADANEAKYLRMTVSLGIGGVEGGGEEEPNALFLTRVKNAMLSVLGTKTSEDVLSVKGKAKLRKQLLRAAQAVSEEPHVEAIYITDFIVQL